MFTPAARMPSNAAIRRASEPAPAASPAAGRRPLGPGEIAALLYAASALVLLWRLATNPGYPFNWEEYTAWNLFRYWEAGPFWRDILAPGNGVMTDSGRGLLVGFPGAASFAMFGVGLGQLRVPVALLAAFAPPLLWLAGRLILPRRVALTGAALLAVCPVFVLYGRTATLVGVSLVPLLLAFWALAAVLAAPTGAIGWPAAGLAASLALGVFAYAPVRLMWPIAVAVLVVAALLDRKRRAGLLGAAALALVAVPAALVGLDAATARDPQPAAAVSGYFRARDETILSMPATDRHFYLRPDAPAIGPTAVRLVLQNARDLARIALDRGTNPLREAYWNTTGSIWPAWFGILALAGGVLALVRVARRREWGGLLALACAGGFAAPLLLTSRVDSGRLLAAVPFACLLAALAIDAAAGGLARLVSRADPRSWLPRILPIALPAAAALALLGASAEAMRKPAMISRQVNEALAMEGLASRAPEAGVVLVVQASMGPEIERVHAGNHRLLLDGVYRMEDLHGPDALVRGRERPRLRYGEALAELESGDFPGACDALYAIQPEVREQVEAALKGYGCERTPEIIDLPR